MELPSWLTRNDKGVFTIDPGMAYPEVMAGLKITEKMLDQYWIETIYQCAKLETLRVIAAAGIDPRPEKVLVIHIDASGGRKDRWALANFKPGRGAPAATTGREAREHYRRWRGFVPN